MWIFLSIVLSFSVFALEPFESFKNLKILKVLPRNIILIPRGLEDGINRNDHARITSDTDEFGSRAICLKSNAATSYWKLYRIPRAEAFSLDLTYTLTGIADREIPSEEAKLRDTIQTVDDPTPEKNEVTPNPFQIKRDLPEKLSERDLIQAVAPEQRKLFVEEAINKERLKKDFTDYRFSFYASPFSKQTINNAENLRYGFRGGNIASRYLLTTQFDQQQTRLKDPVTKETLSTRSTNGQVQFVMHEFKKNISTLSLINYNSNRFSKIYTPRHHWQVGVIGLTWNLYESNNWEYADFSYIPLYDQRTTEVLNIDGSISVVNKTGLRHGFRLGARKKINERVSLENLLWARPYQDLKTGTIQSDDLNLVNDLKLVVSLGSKFFLDYNFIYQKDKLWRKLSNLPDTNIINSVNFRYDLDI